MIVTIYFKNTFVKHTWSSVHVYYFISSSLPINLAFLVPEIYNALMKYQVPSWDSRLRIEIGRCKIQILQGALKALITTLLSYSYEIRL